MNQVRMRATMSAALEERQMLGVVNFLGQSEFPYRFGKKVGEVWNLDLRWNVRFRLLGRMNHVWLIVNKRPLETLLRSVHVEAFPILPGDIVETAPDVRG